MHRLALTAALCLFACSDSDADDDGSTSDLDAVQAELLEAHNATRATVDVSPLSYNTTVEASAQTWADALVADSCAFEHDNQQTYGENLWWSSYDPSPTEVVEGWASEVAYYDYDANKCDPGQMCGHYTQVVWANTTSVGCGKGTCGNGSVIWVCRYDPPGNWVGEKPY